ncbi:MAG: zf-HC2 domain-containing protein [Gemmatimonadota bacterium]
MFRSPRHPGFRKLNRYVDGDLGERDRARVAAHLARCGRCRETVARVRALGAAARDLHTPAVPENLIELALRRRAAGERVILPQTPPGAPRRPSYMLPIAAAAILLLAVAVVLVLRAPSLQAARGGLTITPAQPEAGALLLFDYEDVGRFQGQQRLIIRARYRTEDRRYQLAAGTLNRSADGHFRGAIVLPDSIVYAAFAVEDPVGRNVDSNGRRFWDVMVHARGRPTFDALFARLDDLFPRDWEGAFRVARRMTELYPDRPASWVNLETFEGSVLDDSTVLPRFRRRLDQLKGTVLAEDPPDPEAMAELAYGYAFHLGQREEAQRLIAAIDAGRGWHRVRLRYRVSLLWIAAGADRTRYLASLDSLWHEGIRGIRVARAGLGSSTELDDPELLWTWYQRNAAAAPEDVMSLLSGPLLRVPALRKRVTGALEHAVGAEAPADLEDRPLYLSVPAYERTKQRELGEARVAVGAALLTNGHAVEALSQVRRAIDDVWEPALLHQAGRILLAHGDTAEAVEAYARMAANPALSPDLHHAITRDLGAMAGTERWNTFVASARAAFTAYVFADRINVPVDTGLVLGDASGNVVPLSQLMSPGATAVAFWSRLSLHAVKATQAIERARRQLAANDIRVVIIATEPGSPDLEQALSRLRVPFPVYTDRKAQASRDFVPPGTPTYYVLDGEGRIRFVDSSLDRMVEQALLLKATTASHATVTD